MLEIYCAVCIAHQMQLIDIDAPIDFDELHICQYMKLSSEGLWGKPRQDKATMCCIVFKKVS